MAKVVRFHELGGPELLRLEEITFEDPAPGELRLKVGAIGLNRREVVYRSGGFGAPNKYRAVLRSECAGTVEAIGKGVTGFKIGDRVATIPVFPTLPGFATETKSHECAVYGEQAYVSAEMAVKMPESMSFISKRCWLRKNAKMTDFVLKGLANGTLKPVNDKTFPLENIVEAHRYLESNQHVRKVRGHGSKSESSIRPSF